MHILERQKEEGGGELRFIVPLWQTFYKWYLLQRKFYLERSSNVSYYSLIQSSNLKPSYYQVNKSFNFIIMTEIF